MEKQRGRRKVKTGVVVSNKMDKTVVVRVDRTVRHAKYGKVTRRGKKYYAHDDSNVLEEGQTVKIVECRPLSKMKRWRVVQA